MKKIDILDHQISGSQSFASKGNSPCHASMKLERCTILWWLHRRNLLEFWRFFHGPMNRLTTCLDNLGDVRHPFFCPRNMEICPIKNSDWMMFY